MFGMWDIRIFGGRYVECLGCGMFRMWDVRDVGCLGCEMFVMWDVGHVEYLGCRMFRMWDVKDVGCLGCGMWDVGCFAGWGMLIYKMPSQNIGRLAMHSTDDSEKNSPPIKKSIVTESNSTNREKIQNHMLQLHAAN